jgi:uncharacterized protein
MKNERNVMAHPDCLKFRSGRIFLYRLPSGEDPSPGITDICFEERIETASFTLTGVLSTVTIGVYDPRQQVHITQTEEAAMEILCCAGNVSIKNDKPCIWATIALADQTGRILGGRLFSPSRSFAVEMTLQELVGPPLQRTYDSGCGLDLWPLRRSKNLSNT